MTVTNHLLHPFGEPARAEADYVNFVRAQGSTLWDDTGKAYLDGTASLWYCQVGHGRREIIDAITAQMEELVVYNTFAPYTNTPSRTLASMIAARSPHPDGRVFLACSGSEAVDSAMKFARLVQQRRGDADKQIIIRRSQGYHGANFGGTSAQGLPLNRAGYGDLLPHMVEVSNDDIEDMARVFAEHGDRVAAVISEPIQGAGGVFMAPPGYLEGMRRLCTDHDALLIFDEVITGFGRTGSWFAAQTFDVTPDLITFAKGASSGYLPVSGVIVSPAVADELGQDSYLLRHGYTYSGHPTAAAAAVANIELIESDGLLERAHQIGRRFTEAFDALRSDGVITDYRGTAAIWAAETGRDATAVKAALLERGVLIRAVGEAAIFCPPLVMTDDEIDQMIERLDDVLRS